MIRMLPMERYMNLNYKYVTLNTMYQMQLLKNQKTLKHAFSTRNEGNMSFKFGDDDEVLSNRRSFLDELGISLADCVVINASHSDEIMVVDENKKGRGAFELDSAVTADGYLCSQKGIFLVLLIADCLSVVVFDSKKNVFGLFHAGWESTDKRVASVGVKKMVEEFGCDPKNMVAALGPCIKKESYRFEDPVQKNSEEWEPFLTDDEEGRTMIDIVGYNTQQLTDAGIVRDNIEISDVNTATDDRFFSHYHDSRIEGREEGRFACVVGLR